MTRGADAMTEKEAQAKFEGWAIVEVFGHQRYAGFVCTEVFGQAVLFRVDVPALEPRQRTTKRPGYHPTSGEYLPAGTVVDEGAVQGYTKLLGTGAIYAITPCTQEAVLKAIEDMQPRPWMKVTVPEQPALAPASVVAGPDDDDDDHEF